MDFNSSNSICYLAISTLVSIAITIVVGYSLLKLTRKETGQHSIFSINPEFGLFELPIFWMGITLPFCLFISSGIPVWSKYQLILSSNAYINFLEISKLPAILLATTIPITAAISRAHSTHQTARQIRELIKNRQLDGIYRHKDEVEKRCTELVKEINPLDDCLISTSSNFFRHTHVIRNFQEKTQANLDVIEVFVENLKISKRTLLKIQDEIMRVDRSNNKVLISNYIELNENLDKFIGRILTISNADISKFKKDDEEVITPILSTDTYRKIINTTLNILMIIITESIPPSYSDQKRAQKILEDIDNSFIQSIVVFKSVQFKTLIQHYAVDNR